MNSKCIRGKRAWSQEQILKIGRKKTLDQVSWTSHKILNYQDIGRRWYWFMLSANRNKEYYSVVIPVPLRCNVRGQTWRLLVIREYKPRNSPKVEICGHGPRSYATFFQIVASQVAEMLCSCNNTNKGGGEKSLIQGKAVALGIYNARCNEYMRR